VLRKAGDDSRVNGLDQASGLDRLDAERPAETWQVEFLELAEQMDLGGIFLASGHPLGAWLILWLLALPFLIAGAGAPGGWRSYPMLFRAAWSVVIRMVTAAVFVGLFWLVYFIAILMTIFYGFVAAANLLAAPFYGYLAEIAEKRLSGRADEGNFTWGELFKMIPQTVKRELQKILYYLPRVLLLFCLGLVPGVNAVAALGWIVFSGWMMAIQYIDYPADNHAMSFPEMRRYLGERRATSFGFGLVAFGASLLPVLNFIALPAAVCAAVLFWLNEERPSASTVKIELTPEMLEKFR